MDLITVPLSISQIFLVPCEGGYLQVDTGYEKDYPLYRERLSRLGIPLSDIRFVFLTHHHDDHAGFLNDLTQDTGCRVIANERAGDLLKKGENDRSRGGGYVNRLIKGFADIKMRFDTTWTLSFPPFELRTDDIVIEGDDNEILRELGVAGKVLYTPGHCADHQVLALDTGVTLCGDAAAGFLLWAGTKYCTVFMTDMEQAYESWQKMIDGGTRILSPAHGKPFGVDKLKEYKGRIKTEDLATFF